MTVPIQEQEISLFLFAHNDDEFFVLPAIDAEIASGHRVVCVYTTDGTAHGKDPTIRLLESRAVLCSRGVKEEDIVPLGTQLGVRDGASFRSMAQLWEALLARSLGWRIANLYVLGWEGGHADHDAGHLLGVALAKLNGVDVYEFSLYNGYKTIGPLFRCMTLIPAAGETKVVSVSRSGALLWILSARHYVSQRRTFAGLIGFCLPQILVRRALKLRRVGVNNYHCPPHIGKLLYESRFNVPHREFISATSWFIREHIAELLPNEIAPL